MDNKNIMMTNDLHVPVTSAALLFNKKKYTSVVHEHCLKETNNVKYNVTVFKTSQLCAVVRCCAQVLVEHCTEFRTSFISN